MIRVSKLPNTTVHVSIQKNNLLIIWIIFLRSISVPATLTGAYRQPDLNPQHWLDPGLLGPMVSWVTVHIKKVPCVCYKN